ncbi:uncharacterized protein DS421_6g196670 [Arachis hypogaea]|nr:uncharacterized protein DS421_6g196670 [Arachis hypogaea]
MLLRNIYRKKLMVKLLNAYLLECRIPKAMQFIQNSLKLNKTFHITLSEPTENRTSRAKKDFYSTFTVRQAVS